MMMDGQTCQVSWAYMYVPSSALYLSLHRARPPTRPSARRVARKGREGLLSLDAAASPSQSLGGWATQ